MSVLISKILVLVAQSNRYFCMCRIPWHAQHHLVKSLGGKRTSAQAPPRASPVFLHIYHTHDLAWLLEPKHLASHQNDVHFDDRGSGPCRRLPFPLGPATLHPRCQRAAHSGEPVPLSESNTRHDQQRVKLSQLFEVSCGGGTERSNPKVLTSLGKLTVFQQTQVQPSHLHSTVARVPPVHHQ